MTFSQGAMATLGKGPSVTADDVTTCCYNKHSYFRHRLEKKKKTREEGRLNTARVYFCEPENDSHRYMTESPGGAGKRNVCILSPDPESPAEF